MRKITLTVNPNDLVREEYGSTFEKIHSFEILEMLKIDYDEAFCVDLMEYTLKDNVDINEIGPIGNMEIISILKSRGNKHVCLIQYTEPEKSRNSFGEGDMGLILSTPTIISEGRFVVSVMGERKNLAKFVEMMRAQVGTIENLAVKKAVYERRDLLSVLTEKQREVFIAANEHGYYDYPKRIGSERLADRVRLSRPTVLQHLRKAEGRLFKEIMAGYSS
ncbi:MAG TPA: helix-turn-helix domain-containing protein [Thermoplasmata archaeon]